MANYENALLGFILNTKHFLNYAYTTLNMRKRQKIQKNYRARNCVIVTAHQTALLWGLWGGLC